MLLLPWSAAVAQDDTVNEWIGHRAADSSAGDEATSQKVLSYTRKSDGLWIKTTGGDIRLQPMQCGAVHVSYGTKKSIDAYTDYVVDGRKPLSKYRVKDTGSEIVVSGTTPSVVVEKATGAIRFTDAAGHTLLKEAAGHARYDATGDSVTPFCRFTLQPEEALYGLGQFRDGYLNLRGKRRELIQFNTQAAVPVVNSTGGWGIIWTNPSRTVFEDSADGMSLRSDYGNIVDYYVTSGESLDGLVGSYRSLTGTMPMLPAWALGFHQSRNRYHTDKEVLGVARRMKEENTPMGSIFIDYHHWGKYGTGSFRFDERFFPDVDKMMDSLHRDYDTHAVLTVWPCFKPDTENYRLMSEKGYILEESKAIDGYIYDVFNPGARKMYRDLFRPMLSHGIDGWFLDGPEPDHVSSFLPAKTYLGDAPRVRNIYPLLHSENFNRLLNDEQPGQRHYMLTRCAWAGQQRYGTAIWSGDIPATMDELKLQIAAGLNFTATGIPYWTTDIGGYLGGDPNDPQYREVFARWFQYGTFCPVFRNHGRRYPGDTNVPNEIWSYGDTVKEICKQYIDLRYRLMPYIRSMAASVTLDNYTPMRLLAFDFPDDAVARECADEFMFGPAFLVAPVTKAGARSRMVYLPEGCGWFDYHTGKYYSGGQSVHADAPLERMPLFVRAGSIIPTDTNGNIELDIYPGNDAEFRMYDEDGWSTDYQKSPVDVKVLKWNDSTHTLSGSDLKVNIRGEITPEQRYSDLQRTLAKGWNTWDVRSVLTHVYLPNALAVDITLEDSKGHRASRFRIGDRGTDAPVLHPYAHTPDGTYSKIGVNWHGAEFIVESAADGTSNLIRISTIKNPEGVNISVEPQAIWKRGGRIAVDSTRFSIATPHNEMTVEGRILGRYAKTERNRIIMDGTSDVTVLCNMPGATEESATAHLAEVASRIAKKARDTYGDSYDSYNAMATALGWNNIYDPGLRRVITPVSRIWSSEWFGSNDFGGFTLFCWDAYFASMMLGVFDKELAYANAAEITSAITESGFVPNCHYSNGFKSRDRSQPPVGSLAAWTLYRQHGDKWFLELLYDNLKKWNGWWTGNRMDGGLICPGSSPYDKVTYFRSEYEQNNKYAANLETGLDNSPMYDGIPFDSDKHLMAQQDVGLSSLFAMDCRYMALIASELGKKDDALMFEQRGNDICNALQGLWNEERGCFYNRSTLDGKHSSRISPTSFYPLLANAATPTQATRMVEEHLLNPDEFWGEYVIPSISRNDGAYKDNEYWRGRIWAPLNLLVYLGLSNYDFPEVRREFAEKSEKLLLGPWRDNGYIFENYNADTGEGDDTVRSDKFYHWGALLGYISLLENNAIPTGAR